MILCHKWYIVLAIYTRTKVLQVPAFRSNISQVNHHWSIHQLTLLLAATTIGSIYQQRLAPIMPKLTGSCVKCWLSWGLSICRSASIKKAYSTSAHRQKKCRDEQATVQLVQNSFLQYYKYIQYKWSLQNLPLSVNSSIQNMQLQTAPRHLNLAIWPNANKAWIHILIRGWFAAHVAGQMHSVVWNCNQMLGIWYGKLRCNSEHAPVQTCSAWFLCTKVPLLSLEPSDKPTGW